MYFLNKSFWTSPALLLVFIVSLSVIIFLRYILFAFIVKVVLRRANRGDRNSTPALKAQITREVRLSLYSSVIFTLTATVTLWLYHHGFTKIYSSNGSGAWFLISIPAFLFLYETYYYWLHRWMHHPKIFRAVHRLHHESMVPTVFAAFAFHPLEALAQFIFFPVALMIFPIHIIALGIVFVILTVLGTFNHSGHELFRHKLFLKWLIGASHHDQHHRNFKTNFGLCVTIWDRVMKTNRE